MIRNMLRKRREKRYLCLFEERFDYVYSRSLGDKDFAHKFIDAVTKRYKNIIEQYKNNGDDKYILKEKIRLSRNIESFSNSEVSTQSISFVLPAIFTMIFFIAGQMDRVADNAFRYIIDSKLKEEQTSENITKIVKEYVAISGDTSSRLSVILLGMFILIIALTCICQVVMTINIHNTKTEEGFERICLDVLEKIEDNEL